MSKQDELQQKRSRIDSYLDTKSLHGIFLTRQNNFAWITGGCENRVGLATEIGAATAYVTRDSIIIITNNIEAPRLRHEELGELDIEVRDYPWFDEAGRDSIIRDLIGSNTVASDTGFSGTVRLDRDFDTLRYSLIDEEIDRYRWLGRNCSLVLERICTTIKQDDSELEIAARLAHEALRISITPTVILVAADDRAFHYRHPLPTEKKVKEHVMVVLGGRRWGLIASVTRLANFGKISPDLRKKHEAVCNIDAALILSSRTGAATGSALDAGIKTYEAFGFTDEWKLHHQGGPTGYEARDYRVVPGDQRIIQPNQAIAWNPSIAGSKSEDTILCTESTPEILTPCHQWPTTSYEYNGMVISRPDIYEV